MKSKDKDQRMTFEEINERYGFKYDLSTLKEGIHPVYKKHLEATWVIDAIWAYVEKEEISTSKARELTSAVIEESVESFRSRVIEELEGMKEEKSYPVTFEDKFDHHTIESAIERIKKMK